LPARLERYIIADDVEIEDVTKRFSLFHLVGGPVPEDVAAAKAITANRLGSNGTDLWIHRTESDRVRQQLSHSGVFFLDAAPAEVRRIEMGIPRWGRELTEDIIPVEANLEEAAIDYGKGCYIGQEVISRMKMSGQTNKRLRGLVSSNARALLPGSHLWSREGPVKEAGWVTSAAHSDRLGKEIALGYVKRGFNDDGSQLLAGPSPDDAAAVIVVPLPFA
ncbi:MAG TPA: glycine cleavage T C-terminal barrel domain-containing protein, partial [Chthoniobacterales bacterium]|nr:glycine cleavage T C-terminal barrel domain-containing protein [Chthoniobacterales bacterium]